MTNSNLSNDPLLIVYITIEALIGLMATLGNVLVIWVVRLIPANQNTTFYFIVSLALADIAVGILVVPLAIVVSLGLKMHFYACLLICTLLMVFSHASIMSLMAIAVDRYLRVKVPTQINKFRKTYILIFKTFILHMKREPDAENSSIDQLSEDTL
uniref:Adenosine receptor A3 n=1 Tax=Sphaerodactylus townsendi TaxID=933632 RepID=A0ACB8F5Q8_9SAUR